MLRRHQRNGAHVICSVRADKSSRNVCRKSAVASNQSATHALTTAHLPRWQHLHRYSGANAATPHCAVATRTPHAPLTNPSHSLNGFHPLVVDCMGGQWGSGGHATT